MSDTKKRCSATTTKGSQCKKHIRDNSEFCLYHQPERKRSREKQTIRAFLAKHKEGVLSFLAGSATDPVASDIYDFIKEQLGLKHLVPLVASSPELSQLEQASKHFKEYHDYESLIKLLQYLSFGEGYEYLTSLFGDPVKSSLKERQPLPAAIQDLSGAPRPDEWRYTRNIYYAGHDKLQDQQPGRGRTHVIEHLLELSLVNFGSEDYFRSFDLHVTYLYDA